MYPSHYSRSSVLLLLGGLLAVAPRTAHARDCPISVKPNLAELVKHTDVWSRKSFTCAVSTEFVKKLDVSMYKNNLYRVRGKPYGYIYTDYGVCTLREKQELYIYGCGPLSGCAVFISEGGNIIKLTVPVNMLERWCPIDSTDSAS
jgi:hypothetical protein